LSGLGELKCAGLLGDNSTLVLWLQLGDELGDKSAGLLWVEITDLFGYINKGSQDLVVAFFVSFGADTSGTTDLNGELFTCGISNKLAWLFLNILGSTGRFINGSAFFRSLAVAFFDEGFVALLDGFFGGLLLESDRTLLFEVLFTDLLLGG